MASQEETPEPPERPPVVQSEPTDDAQLDGDAGDEGEAADEPKPEPIPEEGIAASEDANANDEAPRNYAQEDLKAQERMAVATEELVRPTERMADLSWWQVVVTALGTALLLLTLFVSALATRAAGRAADAAAAMVKQGEAATEATLIAANAAVEANKAAVEANKIQREAFVADQRAWLVIESSVVTSDLIWDREKKRGAFSVRTKIKNTGKTAAVDTRVETKSDARMQPREDIYREVALEAAKTYRSVNTRQPVIMGNTVFPGGGILFDSNVTITEDDFDAMREAFKIIKDFWKESFAVSVTFCVCVGYGLIYPDKRHQTGCILRLDVLPDKEGNVAIGPYFGDTPKSRLRLVPDFFNSVRAD